MEYLTLRDRIVEYFARDNALSLGNLFRQLTNGNPPEFCYSDGGLKNEVALQVTAIVYEMIRCGILAPAFNWNHVVRKRKEHSYELPLQITEFGKRVLKGDKDAVWDPTGYLADVKKRVRGMTKLELSYLEESVRAFHLCLYKASLVMLGGASEALMIRCIRTTSTKLPDGNSILGKLQRNISEGFGAWRRSLEQNKTTIGLESEWFRDIDHTFEIIRRCRNESAHPKSVETDRLEVQMLLLAFRRYAQSLLTLVKQLSKP